VAEESFDKSKPSRRQIVLNWLMRDDMTAKDGWWGGSEAIAYVDELLVALDSAPSHELPIAPVGTAMARPLCDECGGFHFQGTEPHAPPSSTKPLDLHGWRGLMLEATICLRRAIENEEGLDGKQGQEMIAALEAGMASIDKASAPSTTEAKMADWYCEYTEAEVRRRYQSDTDHDAPDHMRGETFEKWAEAEGYIRGSALRSLPSATLPTKLTNGREPNKYQCGYTDGWNDCIDEMRRSDGGGQKP
jgi:hypothetical protein